MDIQEKAAAYDWLRESARKAGSIVLKVEGESLAVVHGVDSKETVDDLVKALQGLKTIVELSVASKDGRQYAYIETRSGSFVHVVGALKEAEAALAKVGA